MAMTRSTAGWAPTPSAAALAPVPSPPTRTTTYSRTNGHVNLTQERVAPSRPLRATPKRDRMRGHKVSPLPGDSRSLVAAIEGAVSACRDALLDRQDSD